MEKKNNISLFTFLLSLIILALLCALLISIIAISERENKKELNEPIAEEKVEVQKPEVIQQSEEEIKNKIDGNELCDFDLSFLKEKNNNKNKVYSPLSIKIALKMLEEGAEGESKEQISKYIKDYNPTKYIANSNMAFANAIFVRDTYKIKDKYITKLEDEYNAEAISDSFSNADNINKWVSKNTLKLINNLLDDIDADTNFILINALGIDMEWKDKFLDWEDGRRL